jgi:hypothetical protein
LKSGETTFWNLLLFVDEKRTRCAHMLEKDLCRPFWNIVFCTVFRSKGLRSHVIRMRMLLRTHHVDIHRMDVHNHIRQA